MSFSHKFKSRHAPDRYPESREGEISGWRPACPEELGEPGVNAPGARAEEGFLLNLEV
jgi:hypothetical protein